MSVGASDEARLMIRPFRTYRELAAKPPARGAGPALGKAALLVLVLGAFVSLTAAGRLVAAHVAFTAVFWCFVPILQALAIALLARLLCPARPAGSAIALYFAGHGPWLLLLLLLAGVCLVAPDVYRAFVWMTTSGVLPALFAAALIWAGTLTYAFFREALSLPRGRAAAGAALFYLLYYGALASWLFATNQLQPQLFGTR